MSSLSFYEDGICWLLFQISISIVLKKEIIKTKPTIQH